MIPGAIYTCDYTCGGSVTAQQSINKLTPGMWDVLTTRNRLVSGKLL